MWQPVWRSGVFSPGGIRAALWQGQGLLLVHPSRVPWWVSVISPHYSTLDQKADEMEVLGRWLQTKSARGRTTGWDEEMVAQVTPPLLPAPEKLSPGHKAEKKKKEGKHCGSPVFCNGYEENRKYVGAMDSWGSFCCLPPAVKDNTKTSVSVFLNVNRKRMSWYYGPDSAKNPGIFIMTFSDKEHLQLIQLILTHFNSVIIRIEN